MSRCVHIQRIFIQVVLLLRTLVTTCVSMIRQYYSKIVDLGKVCIKHILYLRARLTHRRISCTIMPDPYFTVAELLCASYRLRNMIMKRLSAFKHVPSDEGFQGTAKRQILLIGLMVPMFKCQRVLT